jgi:hypothetical protein
MTKFIVFLLCLQESFGWSRLMQKERKEGGPVLPLEGPGPFLFFLRCHRGKGKLSIFFIIR